MLGPYRLLACFSFCMCCIDVGVIVLRAFNPFSVAAFLKIRRRARRSLFRFFFVFDPFFSWLLLPFQALIFRTFIQIFNTFLCFSIFRLAGPNAEFDISHCARELKVIKKACRFFPGFFGFGALSQLLSIWLSIASFQSKKLHGGASWRAHRFNWSSTGSGCLG